MRNRYMVFTGPEYYASGGAEDLVGFADTSGDAVAMALASYRDPSEYLNWGHIYDLHEQRIILEWAAHSESEEPKAL